MRGLRNECRGVLLAAALLLLGGCAAAAPATQEVDISEETDIFSEEEVRALAWQALEPNTSSHDLANWDVLEVRQVTGQEVAGEFEGDPAYGCPGPTPVPNAAIAASPTYWYVQFQKRPATPPAGATPLSPTAPPNVPEPFLYQARFLLDPDSGQVVARMLLCVIY
jgi:hypothetical protein